MKLGKYLLILIISFNILAAGEIVPGKLIVKFRQNSTVLASWLKNDRLGEISEIKNIVGNHTSKPFIGDNTLKAVSKATTNNSLIAATSDRNIERIAIIEFSENYNPVVISKKLSSLPFIEYAEPMPQHKIDFIPNDPKISGQYYLDSVSAYQAWDLIDTTLQITVGIVDTGIDYNHEDLWKNIFENPGETGLDSLGRDKRFNGVDDDNNGFIDDWHGWNFNTDSTKSGQSNDPKPGHMHGTHVGGTVGAIINNGIGIAGVARNVKLLPVKVAGDNPSDGSISNGYDGILYAAAMGAKVINCSWGSTTYSDAEQEIIDKTVTLGSLVVAAAGNDSQYEVFYPASYNGVLSVAAINSANLKAAFSNFCPQIDVSAPGEDILATIPNNSYELLNGTSMASPVASGVAAMISNVFPDYNPLQVHEHIKANSDNLDSINQSYIGLIGKGRVNAYKALSNKNSRSVILKNYTVNDANGDGNFDIGETVTIDCSFLNVLAPVKNTGVKLISKSINQLNFQNDTAYIGNMSTMEMYKISQPFSFVVPNNIGYDVILVLEFVISDSSGVLNRQSISLFLNPSYRNFNDNNITTTINSRGNIGFNDYPNDAQGKGFEYLNSSNLLFEGALMIATSPTKVSNVARGESQNYADNMFKTKDIVKLVKPGEIADFQGFTSFHDYDDSSCAGVYVMQNIYQFNTEGNKDYIISVYDVVNRSNSFFDSLFVGIYFDWDIGASGANNLADFDDNGKFGFVRNVKDSSLPFVGVKLLSNQKLNYWAMDNGGSTSDNPGVYNGFSFSDKWKTMSSGLKRKKSSVTDISQVISAGPIKLLAGDTVRITFGIIAGKTLSDLRKSVANCQANADLAGLSLANYRALPNADDISIVYPNASITDNILINYIITEKTSLNLDLYDVTGNLVIKLADIPEVTPGRYSINLSTNGLAQGSYWLRQKTGTNVKSRQIIIVK